MTTAKMASAMITINLGFMYPPKGVNLYNRLIRGFTRANGSAMFTILKASTFLLLFLTLSNLCSSETVYLTFPKTNSGTTLTQQDLSLRINNVDVRPSEFFAVNTSSRDPALLSHPAGRRQYFI